MHATLTAVAEVGADMEGVGAGDTEEGVGVTLDEVVSVAWLLRCTLNTA